MSALAVGNLASTTAWLWDGGSFRRDFVDMPNIELLRHNGNLPFSLDQIDLAKLPAVLKAARDKEPSGQPRIMIAKAIKGAWPSARPSWPGKSKWSMDAARFRRLGRTSRNAPL
jgi:hypothetical protein